MVKPKFKNAVELFAPSVEIIRDNLTSYLIVLVMPSLLVTLGGVSADPESPGNIFSFFGFALTIIFIPALVKLYLITAKGKKDVTLSILFKDSYRYFWRLLGLGILVGLIVLGGFILFIIPGLIMLRRYVLSPFYLMDKNLSITDAMKVSAEHTKPYSWKIYEVLAVLFVIALFSAFGPIGAVIGAVLSITYAVALPLRYYEVIAANKS